jgi:cation diffusion facilitator family transporter
MPYKKKFNFWTKLVGFFDVESPVFSTRMSLLICSVFASSGIYLGISQDSLAVQINGLIAAIDVLNSLLFITAVNQTVKSPDIIYNYGYGKYESISILAAAGLLIIVFGYAIYEAVISFGTNTSEAGNYFYLLLYSLFNLTIMIGMYKYQRKMAKKYKMPILEYDAEIWKIDSFIEMGVIINLLFGTGLKFFGFGHLAILIDSITALLLLIFALKVPLKGSRDALNQLLDKTLPDDMQFQLLAVITDNISMICEFKHVHTRQSGKDIFVEIDVVLPFDYTIKQKYDLELQIKEQILAIYPTSVPRMYAISCDGNCTNGNKSNCPVRMYLLEKEAGKE